MLARKEKRDPLRTTSARWVDKGRHPSFWHLCAPKSIFPLRRDTTSTQQRLWVAGASPRLYPSQYPWLYEGRKNIHKNSSKSWGLQKLQGELPTVWGCTWTLLFPPNCWTLRNKTLPTMRKTTPAWRWKCGNCNQHWLATLLLSLFFRLLRLRIDLLPLHQLFKFSPQASSPYTERGLIPKRNEASYCSVNRYLRASCISNSTTPLAKSTIL